MGTRPRYWLTRTKVGLVARVVAPRPRTSPWMKQVFPAPSSPTRATTSPGPSAAASCSPAASVSSALVVRSSVVTATEPPERLGKGRDDVAGDQRLLADARGGDVAREPVEVDGRLERHARGHPAREEGAARRPARGAAGAPPPPAAPAVGFGRSWTGARAAARGPAAGPMPGPSAPASRGAASSAPAPRAFSAPLPETGARKGSVIA